ncbi:protein-export chaperone SecB, partial [Acinetobacter baumannii]
GIRNLPTETVQAFVLGEAPRLLFPFARRVLADAVRDGGFPPLLLDPIDFNSIYTQQMQQQLSAGADAGNA